MGARTPRSGEDSPGSGHPLDSDRASLRGRERTRKIEVRESPIHGRGIFAARRLRRGAYIGTFEGSATTEDGPHVLWYMQDNGEMAGILGKNELRFLNHSRKPNAEFYGPKLYALRNIQAGEEVLLDYGPDWTDVE